MPQILMDPESRSLRECFALVKTPRRNRFRYPEACVTPVAGKQEARAEAEPAHNLHPALVYGPSKSSEEQRVYYLIRWFVANPEWDRIYSKGRFADTGYAWYSTSKPGRNLFWSRLKR